MHELQVAVCRSGSGKHMRMRMRMRTNCPHEGKPGMEPGNETKRNETRLS